MTDYGAEAGSGYDGADAYASDDDGGEAEATEGCCYDGVETDVSEYDVG